MREKVTKKFPVANLGYQLKNQVAHGNFQWSMGYRATVNAYSGYEVVLLYKIIWTLNVSENIMYYYKV